DMSIDGRLTASLSLEGRWDDPRSRRGRGDVLVEGREMYRVPVLFGLMQMANLSLPGDAPFRQAGLQYSVQGNRVNLEAIDLRSTNTSMSGNGWIDFESKQVQMTLLMSNSAADAMPLFGDLIRGARQDLMQIRVRGSLQEPKVGASTFNTLTTTVDEVLRGKQ
ncbi:MAG TPA: AsmA-like C-terminal domain-containing protein, partial [Tepidisphaeraceae bacterium]